MRRYWTTTEIAQMRALYPDLRAKDVAAIIGRDVKAVYMKAKHLGLTKSEAFKASDLSARIRRGQQSPTMIASRIQPGAAPWNKGKKWDAGGRSHETRFKADGSLRGAAQHNYQPIGTLRVSKEGYLERKMNDDHPVPARRWVAVHRLLWEAANGPIPAGHIVVFRPGMKTAIEAEVTADRLECISRAENAHRNHPRNRDPELGRLVQLKGAITRQVNRIAREAQEQAS